jgi:hypothetical protein
LNAIAIPLFFTTAHKYSRGKATRSNTLLPAIATNPTREFNMSGYWDYIPHPPRPPRGTQWWELPNQPVDMNFHEDLYRRYGPHYRRHPDAVFQYNGGWMGEGAQNRYDDWQLQWLDMQQDGGVAPAYGGFVHGPGYDVWWN